MKPEESVTEDAVIPEESWERLFRYTSKLCLNGHEILVRLKANDNRPTLATKLTSRAFNISNLNRELRVVCLPFEVRSIEPEKKGMWSQRFRLVPTN